MKKHIEYIDVARGVAMLSVILGHCYSSVDATLNKFILGFHMPLFFFLSGILCKHQNTSMIHLWGGVKTKAIKILMPQILLGCIMIIKVSFLDWLQGRPICFIELSNCFLIWFLPVLFLCHVLCMLIGTFCNLNNKVVKLVILCCFVAMLPFSIDISKDIESRLYMIFLIVPMAFCFFMFGNMMKTLVELLYKNRNIKLGILALLSLIMCYIIGNANGSVRMYENYYGNLFLFFSCAIMGIFTTCYFCMFIKESKFLSYVGKNSITFYVWQFAITSTFVSVLNRILPQYTDTNVIAFSAFACSVLVLFGICFIIDRYFPSIYLLLHNKNIK